MESVVYPSSLGASEEDRLDGDSPQPRFDLDLRARGPEQIVDCTDYQTRLASVRCEHGCRRGARRSGSLSRSGAAVVSRGGRPDLAEGDLAVVTAPTTLIVGRDRQVLDLTERPPRR
jgi:hypothetical protein